MQDSIFDPSSNIFHRYPQPLDYLFYPRSVAIVGATEREGSVGRTILWNLLRSPFGGTIYPVNPKRKHVLGVKAYPSILDVPEKVELAVLVTPASLIPDVIRDCVTAKVASVIIISAGFREVGESGIKLEKEILQYAKNSNLRIVGPNCLGVMNPMIGLNATFAADIALKGNIAFISQSGALCTAVLDWSLKEKLGFSAFVSIGGMMDVGWGDFINYFGNDHNTESILIYMESIDNPRAFLSAAREVSLTKPIILIKAGRSKESAKAASSHTGALVGSDEILDVALQRAGVLRVNEISELFSMAEVFAKQPRPKAPKLAIITNAGGPGVIATDALVSQKGELADLSEETIKSLNVVLPKAWSHNNPVDILGDADAERYENAIDIVLKDKGVEGLLVILTPQYMTQPVAIAEKLLKFSKKNNKKPILTSWMGARAVERANEILVNANIPTFDFPDVACKIFAYMWAYSNNLRMLYETPIFEEEEHLEIKADEIKELILSSQKNNNLILSEHESKKILKQYGLDVVETYVAKDVEEATSFANKIGYPVVVKLHSNVITHKAAAGGVKLHIQNDNEVQKAYHEIKESAQKVDPDGFNGVTIQKMMKNEEGYEIIVGSYVDDQFGPAIIFGSGGSTVEVYHDKSLALPPLNSTLARMMMEKTKIFKLIGEHKKNVAKLERFLTRFSNMVIEYPEIMECDINPIIVTKQGVVALDVRIILSPAGLNLPKPAICPYPAKYTKSGSLTECSYVIRPIHPEDEPLVVDFFKDLSEKSLHEGYLRELSYAQLVSHENLIRICFNDYERDISMVAINNNKEIMGIGKISSIRSSNDATFAIVIKDKWQNKGLGGQLLQMLLDIAKDKGYTALKAFMFVNNERMMKLCKKKGFVFIPMKGGKYMKAKLIID